MIMLKIYFFGKIFSENFMFVVLNKTVYWSYLIKFDIKLFADFGIFFILAVSSSIIANKLNVVKRVYLNCQHFLICYLQLMF